MLTVRQTDEGRRRKKEDKEKKGENKNKEEEGRKEDKRTRKSRRRKSREGRKAGGEGRGAWVDPGRSWTPLGKKSPSLWRVSLWTGDILKDKQFPICIRLQEKAFWKKKLNSEIFSCRLIPPLPPHRSMKKARSAHAGGLLQLFVLLLNLLCFFLPLPPFLSFLFVYLFLLSSSSSLRPLSFTHGVH